VNQQCELELDVTGTLLEEIVDDMPYGWNNAGDGVAAHWFAAGNWTGSFVWTDDFVSEDHTAYFTLAILRKPIAPELAASYYLSGDFTRILPYLRLTFATDGIDGNYAQFDSAGLYETPEVDRPELAGNATCTVDGLTIDVVSYFSTGSGFEDDPMTITLTPSLFWEYRDANGLNPKYDSLTGAKL
jgi:hypothetical protein